MKKIIFFNGPPSSGKDTVVSQLVSCYYKASHIKFSRPLKQGLQYFFNANFDYLEANKEKPLPELLGKSWREVQISLSEEWAKKIFGQQVFGRIVLNEIDKSQDDVFFISDSGFYDEAKVLIDFFGEKNCLLVRLRRPNYDFSNDSRSYWNHSYKNLTEITINNDSTPLDLLHKAMGEIDNWMDYINDYRI